MKRLLSVATIALAAFGSAWGQAPVKIGVRAGLNSSNISMKRAVETVQTKEWKKGFVVGAVVDIKLTNHIYLQPGFYYDQRNDNYTTTVTNTSIVDGVQIEGLSHTAAKVGTKWFQIPVLASYRIDLLNVLQIQGDFGPFLAYGLGGKTKSRTLNYDLDLPMPSDVPEISVPNFGKEGSLFRTDWGLKMGVGVLLWHHYYVGAHYMTGFRNLSTIKDVVESSNTHNWQITVGYNF